MGIEARKAMRDKDFTQRNTIQIFIFSVYYVGASEMTPHRGREAPKLPLRRNRRKGGFGARRNIEKGRSDK